MNAPIINAPTISSSAVLVELSMPHYTGNKLDRRASEELATAKRAKRGSARINKSIFADCKELTAITKFQANARNAHYAMTLPFTDSGIRLLPMTKYFDYTHTMSGLQAEYFRLVQGFIDVFDAEVAKAQAEYEGLGELFDPNDYPTKEKVQGKFDFRFNFLPVPEAGHFMIDAANDTADELRTKYQEFYNKQFDGAMNELWQRTYKVLTHMSERLAYEEGPDGVVTKKFRDSLVVNALELVDMLKTCNIGGSAQLSAMASKLEDTLRGVTPEALRYNLTLRDETKAAIDEAIRALPSLDI
jgi:hypothetical protein